MQVGSFVAYLMFFAIFFYCHVRFLHGVNNITLFIRKTFEGKLHGLIVLHLSNSIKFFGNLHSIAFFLCVQIIAILDRFPTRKFMQQSVMDMVLQKSRQMPEVASVILFDLL